MKENRRFNIKIIALILGITVSSCHKSSDNSIRSENPENSVEEGMATDRALDLTLTREQFEASGMKIGKPETMVFDQTINVTGYIRVAPSGMAKVSSLIPGRIASIHTALGSVVIQGQPLFSVEGNEIILLQQEYGESFHQMKVLKSDFDRLKSLSDEKIVAEKEFLKAESDFYSMRSKTEGMKARLKLVNIDPSAVENGKIYSSIEVLSPIGGYITALDMVLGQNIDQQTSVLEVVAPGQLQLQLNIFEKDIAKLAPGQHIIFRDPADKNISHKATLSALGRSVDQDSKTINCIARLQAEDQNIFMNNTYVEAQVITCQREVSAIPDQALLKEENSYYLFVLKKDNGDQMIFNKVPVETGVIQKGYAEIMDTELNYILVEGVYNLVSGE